MRGKLDVRERRAIRVEAAQSAVSVSHVDATGLRIVSNVGGISAGLCSVDGRQRRAVIEDRRTISAVRHHNAISIRQESYALWFVQPCDRLDDPHRADVDDLDGVIAQRGDEETFARQIDGEMIDSS